MSDYLIYTGKDKGWLVGVPTRNLSLEEAEKHGVLSLIMSGLYERPKQSLTEVIETPTEQPKRTRRKKESE